MKFERTSIFYALELISLLQCAKLLFIIIMLFIIKQLSITGQYKVITKLRKVMCLKQGKNGETFNQKDVIELVYDHYITALYCMFNIFA